MHNVLFHPEVEGDLDTLGRSWQKRIVGAIASKLAKDPASFGKPLRHELRNYYSLRVGDYRVIYFLEPDTVYVVMVRHRKDVYKEAVNRVIRN